MNLCVIKSVEVVIESVLFFTNWWSQKSVNNSISVIKMSDSTLSKKINLVLTDSHGLGYAPKRIIKCVFVRVYAFECVLLHVKRVEMRLR